MIEPNFDLLLWIWLILWGLKGISELILGCIGTEKDQKYGGLDIVSGLITIILILWVLVA